MGVSIGLTGDVMLGRNVDERQRQRPPEAVWGSLRSKLRNLDGLVVNLECCLSTRGERWTRTDRRFHFRADPDWAVPALRDAGVDYCALANNHVLDFEVPALEDTLSHLDDAGIAHSGAGSDLDAALDPALVAVDSLDVAVVSLTDNTPEYAADVDSPGTARVEFDVENERTLHLVGETLERARRTDPDLLVASLHWGPNMVTEPPAEFEAFGHWLVDQGIDLVHGHSAHVFQGIEVYDGAPILYDTGDFVDDYAVDRRLRNDRSFLFVASVEDGSVERLRLYPTQIADCRVHAAEDTAAHEADTTAAGWARERMRELSRPYGTEFETDGETLVVAV